jgi:hypothetical protein
MKNDYLWDGKGEPDREVERLESLFGALRYDRPAPDFPEIPVTEPGVRGRWFSWMIAAWRPAAAVPALAGIVLVIAASWWALHGRASYDVIALQGTPRVGSAHIRGSGRLSVGQWLETDASSHAKINIGEIGQVEIEPNTRIGLVRARAAEHRLSLQRGVMHALIWAPPGQFFVNTPSAMATDLGCAYTLQVDDDGVGLLQVTSGWVAFENNGREAFVPAGAMCSTRPAAGPGTPYQGDASAAFRSALERLDFQAADPESRATALGTVLAEARDRDALTLWHLLFRSNDVERSRIYERLAVLVPPPNGVTRAGVLNRDQGMLDLWWNALALGDTNWWRMWKRPWPADK